MYRQFFGLYILSNFAQAAIPEEDAFRMGYKYFIKYHGIYMIYGEYRENAINIHILYLSAWQWQY